MTEHDGERELEVLLSFLLNRQLKQGEIIQALGISRSTFNDQKTQGQLANPKNLIAAANFFGLNAAELLMYYGFVSADDVVGLAEKIRNHPPIATGKEVLTTTLNGYRAVAASHHLGPPI